MKRWLALFLLLLPMSGAFAQFDQSHAAWNALLKKHVVLINGGKASQVRYDDFAKDRAALKAYLDSVSKGTHSASSPITHATATTSRATSSRFRRSSTGSRKTGPAATRGSARASNRSTRASSSSPTMRSSSPTSPTRRRKSPSRKPGSRSWNTTGDSIRRRTESVRDQCPGGNNPLIHPV